MIKRLQSFAGMVPLYHPTTLLLVDDNEDFLRSMTLVLGPDFQCFSFHSAAEAIAYVRAGQVRSLEAAPLPDPDGAEALEHVRDTHHRLLQHKIARWPRMFADHDRFATLSVIVADHAMPLMSGIAMFDQLGRMPLRKLLLSGVADEQLALDAFNAGRIDAFFPKQHPALHDALTDHLRKLQIEFFRELTNPFQPVLTMPDTRFLGSAAFKDVFLRFVGEHRIVEYCVLTQPPGILGLDDAGEASILAVVDEDYRRAAFEIAQAELAPTALLSALLDGNAIACFPTANGFYSLGMASRWRPFVLPGTALDDGGLRYAVIQEPEMVRHVCGSVASHAEYRGRRLS